MNSMTLAGPTANTVFMAAPHSAPSVIPESTTQVTMHPPSQPQVNPSPGDQPGLQTPKNVTPAQKNYKEVKTLGALQILIGLVHFGLGGIMVTGPEGYEAISFVSGCAFWGGVSFIISGSLSVASEQQPNSLRVLKGGVGMNILSAIFSVAGICVYVVDLTIITRFHNTVNKENSALATSGVLLTFSFVELCVASICAHFGCKLVTFDSIYQRVSVSNQVPNPEPGNLPPS